MPPQPVSSGYSCETKQMASLSMARQPCRAMERAQRESGADLHIHGDLGPGALLEMRAHIMVIVAPQRRQQQPGIVLLMEQQMRAWIVVALDRAGAARALVQHPACADIPAVPALLPGPDTPVDILIVEKEARVHQSH